MANFQLDTLSISKNGGNFDLTGTFDSIVGPPPLVPLTPTIPWIDNNPANNLEKLMYVDVSGQRMNRVDFKFNGLSFANDYGRQDYLSIIVYDTINPEEIEIAGIVVKDTDYPPPYKQGQAFTEALTTSDILEVEKIVLTRLLDTTYFAINIDLSFTNADFSAVDYDIVFDSTRRDLPVLALQVINNGGAPVNGTLNFPSRGMIVKNANLILYTNRGLPVIITEDPLTHINWLNIKRKKALLFIDTPTIIRV